MDRLTTLKQIHKLIRTTEPPTALPFRVFGFNRNEFFAAPALIYHPLTDTAYISVYRGFETVHKFSLVDPEVIFRDLEMSMELPGTFSYDDGRNWGDIVELERGQRYHWARTLLTLTSSGRNVVYHSYQHAQRFARLLGIMAGETDPSCKPFAYRGYVFPGRVAERNITILKSRYADKFYRSCVKKAKEGDGRDLAEFFNDLPHMEGFSQSDITEEVRHISDGDVIYGTCGHYVTRDDATETANGDYYCQDCADEDLRWVEDGGRPGYYHTDDVYYWDSDGEYHLDPEPEPDDEDEYEEEQRHGSPMLSSWGASTAGLSHDRSFISSPWGEFIMGIELEVEADPDEGSYRGEHIRQCHEFFNATHGISNYAMFKKDGSLNDERGFEIVTAARRLTDHARIFKAWHPEGLIAWNAESCGMHVHIDSRAFSALTLGRFLLFWNDPKNADFIRSIAGRHASRDSQAEDYAALTGMHRNVAHAKRGAGNSRYRIVNLTNLGYDEQRRLQISADRDSKGNYSTVEIRAFRASLRKERLIAQIEFAHATVMFCRVASNGALNKAGFTEWLATTMSVYPYLAKWFKVRKPKVVLRPAQITRASEELVEV